MFHKLKFFLKNGILSQELMLLLYIHVIGFFYQMVLCQADNAIILHT